MVCIFQDRYTLFYCNTTWYIFLRLHQILCSRLLKAYTLTQKLIQEEAVTKKERKDSVALALRLRSPCMLYWQLNQSLYV